MPLIFQNDIFPSKQYRRIVSVVPSQTELLADLGLNEEVIAITKFCIHPDHWFRTKQRVGGTKKLHVDTIQQLSPDLVIANKEENIRSEIEAIAAFTDVYVSDIDDLNGSLQMIHEIGQLTGKSTAAINITDRIKEAFNSLPEKKHGTAAYLIWKDPYMTAGSDTFIHDMMARAGFTNAFAQQKRYPEISIEGLIKTAPEFILLSSEPYPFKQQHIQELQIHLPQAKIMLVDGEMFSWYGSRLVQAPAYFNALLAE